MKRGDTIERNANPRHQGIIEQVARSKSGALLRVKWDNGWKENLPADEVSVVTPDRSERPTEIELLRQALRDSFAEAQ